MAKILHVDFETFSECDLKSAGVFRYAEHPSTEIMACSYQFDDGLLMLWIPYDSVPQAIIDQVKALRPNVSIIARKDVPKPIVEHIKSGGEIRAHNAQFERVVNNGAAGRKLGLPGIGIEQTMCTAAKMAASGLPRALGDAALALGTPPKSEGGRIEMLQLSQPRKPTKDNPDTRFTMEKFPEKWVAMLVYNIDDTPAERGIDDVVPDLIPSEVEIYHLDQHINQRGWAVNLEAVNNILFVVEEYKKFLAAECRALTEDWKGDGLEPTQREKLAEWVRTNGWPHLTDMQAETIKALVKRPEIPECVKRLLVIYSTYNAKSVSKLQAIVDSVCSDGRIRGMFLYHGAGPGRWSSLIVQLQNVMRPLIDNPVEALEAFATRNLAYVRMLYPDMDVMKVAGSCLRACLVAAPGHSLIFVDYKGVETRGNAWIFDDEADLEMFRQEDAGKTEYDSYQAAYAELFNVRPDLVKKPERQKGKVFRLAFGYEGGANACVTMVDTYGVNIQELTDALLPVLSEEARSHGEWMFKHHRKIDLTHDQQIALEGAKFTWRKKHPKIVQGWKDLKKAAEMACEFEGKAFSIPNGKIWFKVVEYKGRKWLHMKLPSGRDIKYYNPRWIEEKTITRPVKQPCFDGGFAYVDEQITIPGEFRYWGVDTDTRQWMELSTYGGKLDENADQGFCSCLLRNGMRHLEAAGYNLVGTVHDEAIAEVPDGFGSVEEAGKLMCKQPAYADGLPLAIEGMKQTFYWKQ